MELRIEQQYAQIGLNTQKPFLALQTTLPRVELQTDLPRVKLQSERSRLSIDQSQCFADAGRRNVSQFRDYYREYSQSCGYQAIVKISSEGDMLGHLEKGITIEDLAASAMDSDLDYNVAAVPSQPPHIEFHTSPVNVDFIPGTVHIQAVPGQVENQFQWGKVEIYLRQKNYVKIDWLPSKHDYKA
ncbi:DUF6470 family protein [Syntrophomonas erecta]